MLVPLFCNRIFYPFFWSASDSKRIALPERGGGETLKYAYYLHVIALPSINLGCCTQFISS